MREWGGGEEFKLDNVGLSNVVIMKIEYSANVHMASLA